MFETNMMQNIAQQSALKAIQGDSTNPWRKLVTKEFGQYLDSITIAKTTVEDVE